MLDPYLSRILDFPDHQDLQNCAAECSAHPGVFGLCGLLDLQNSAHPARRSLALLKGDAPGCRVAHALVVLQVDDVDLVRRARQHVVRVEVASEPVRLRPPLRLDHVVGGLGAAQLRPLPRALLPVVQRDPDALLSGRRQAHSVRVDVQLGEVELIHVGEHGDGGSLLGASCPPWDFTDPQLLDFELRF